MTDIDDNQTFFPVLGEADIKRRSEAERRLPTWLSLPTQFQAGNLSNSGTDIDEFADYIDRELINHIKVNLSINKLFPVQKCLIPALTKQFRSRDYRRPNDICVSSPTGSGKTLSFIIPIVSYLKQTLARRLRAVAVLPSHDLAHQVFKSFIQVSQHTHIRCGLATGEAQDRGFVRKLTKHTTNDCGTPQQSHNSMFIAAANAQISNDYEYMSTIDILVSTPGILVDLLQNMPGFSLGDLEILVIDEADRLMINHKHDWLNAVEKAACPQAAGCICLNLNSDSTGIEIETQRKNYFSANGCTIKHSAQSKPLHKLLFSATLSSDPQTLMQMNLFQPRLFLATKPSVTSTKIRNSLGSHTSTPGGSPLPFPTLAPTTVSTRSELLTSTAIPEELEEKMFITETKDKLYVMWYLMHELKYKKVLCFTNDKRKSHELFVFLNEIADVRAVNFSSDIKQEARRKVIDEFKQDKIEAIVSTDLLGRGMDIDGVEYVISYDMPQSGTWYAHRVGRTARAGRKGTAITLVDSKQLVQFKKIVQLAHKMPNSMRLSDVVEEMKVPHLSQKDDRRDLYIKTYENYKDKLRAQREKVELYRNKRGG